MYSITIEISYTSFLSKNKKYQFRKCKKLHPEYIKIKNQIGLLFKTKLKEYPKPLKAKTRVDFTWYRKTMQGDTSNLREGIDDAIKEVLGIDDNYFVGSHDYEVDKINPRVEITLIIYEHEGLLLI